MQDDFPVQSSQRAELCAAKIDLEFLVAANDDNKWESTGDPKDESEAWIIAAGSEYVVRGVTEWLPRWKIMRLSWQKPSKTLLAELIEEQVAHTPRHQASKSRLVSGS